MKSAPKPEQIQQWAEAFAKNPDNTGIDPDNYIPKCSTDVERALQALADENQRLGLYDDYDKPTRSNSETQELSK